MNVYQERRSALRRRLGEAVLVVPAAQHALRNADTEYEYRQDSDFFYLTGFSEPEAVLVIAPQRAGEAVTLFLRPRKRDQEIWTGRRLGVEAAAATLGLDAAYPIDEFDRRLADFLVGAPTLYYAFGRDEAFDRRVHAALTEARYRVRRGGTAPSTFIEPATLVHELRLHKSAAEIETMRRAAQITRIGHVAAMSATRPGLYEYELEAIIEFQYRLHGAQDVAYPSIVASGENACILHYNSNRDELRDGTLLLVDSGCEVDSYASDVTRTWPVNGRFTPEQRAIYEIVLRAQETAIGHVRPGEPFDAYHNVAKRVLTEGLIDLGLLSGSIDGCIESKAIDAFYPHRAGHWIGLDVHDAGRYKNLDDTYRTLEAGMVLTVEPGLYIQPDSDADERFRGIGVRIEDDVLCTTGGPDILSAGIPKTIADVEALVGADALTSA
ncbi:MAG TPA: aminopeptidase P N-terminal domain-containing protein [Candidatus Acidoferrales bacterium]|nr:aminopeptidase P N-terminal domain-containing protein [Candidatus Acidoferrales bacterium]